MRCKPSSMSQYVAPPDEEWSGASLGARACARTPCTSILGTSMGRDAEASHYQRGSLVPVAVKLVLPMKRSRATELAAFLRRRWFGLRPLAAPGQPACCIAALPEVAATSCPGERLGGGGRVATSHQYGLRMLRRSAADPSGRAPPVNQFVGYRMPPPLPLKTPVALCHG